MSRRLFFVIFIILFFFLIIIFTTGFSYIKNKISQKNYEEIKYIKKERVSFNTEDGVTIVGDFYYNPKSKFAGILIHSLSGNIKAYKKTAEFLAKSGYSILTINLRGHGDSINSIKGLLNWKNFTIEEHQLYIYDIIASSNFLESQGFEINRQFLIGSDIGANLILELLNSKKDIKAGVLLSPLENYLGTNITKYLSKDLSNKIMIIISKNDNISNKTIEIFKNFLENPYILEVEGNLHGEKILDLEGVNDKIRLFLVEHLI